MITLQENGFIPLLEPDEEYVILLDWLEFGMSVNQLKSIKQMWNSGMSLIEIVEQEKRKPLEIVFALLHLAEKNSKMRPMGELF